MHDCLSNILIKRVQNVLIELLTFFINQSLSTGIFPNELKISRVKPMYKSGNASLLPNYRPISVLSSISKVYEYVVFKQLLNYIECVFGVKLKKFLVISQTEFNMLNF